MALGSEEHETTTTRLSSRRVTATRTNRLKALEVKTVRSTRLSIFLLGVAASLPLGAQSTLCSQYPGSSVDEKVNACIRAAIGTVDAIADARGVTGNLHAEIDVGDHAGHAVTLLTPKSGQWVTDINDGTSCAIKQFSNSTVQGTNIGNPFSAGQSSQFAVTTAPGLGTGPGALWCNESGAESSAGGTYVRLAGVAFFNTGLAPMGMGADFVAQDWFDNSDASFILVFDGRNTSALLRGLCCGASFHNATFDGLQTSQGPVLVFANTATQYNGSVTFQNLSVTHPGPGIANIACTNTGRWVGWDGIVIRNLYTETNQSDLTTTMFQCDSVNSLLIDHWNALRMNSSNTAYAISLTNAGAPWVLTQFILTDFTWANGSGPSTNTIDDQINHFKQPSVSLGISALGGGIDRYSSSQQRGVSSSLQRGIAVQR